MNALFTDSNDALASTKCSNLIGFIISVFTAIVFFKFSLLFSGKLSSNFSILSFISEI